MPIITMRKHVLIQFHLCLASFLSRINPRALLRVISIACQNIDMLERVGCASVGKFRQLSEKSDLVHIILDMDRNGEYKKRYEYGYG